MKVEIKYSTQSKLHDALARLGRCWEPSKRNLDNGYVFADYNTIEILTRSTVNPYQRASWEIPMNKKILDNCLA